MAADARAALRRRAVQRFAWEGVRSRSQAATVRLFHVRTRGAVDAAHTRCVVSTHALADVAAQQLRRCWQLPAAARKRE
jgi:hypothetical protein